MPGFPPSMEEMGCTAVAAISVMMTNYFLGKPISARVPRYAVAITGGYFIGVGLTKYNEKRVHDREVHMWDYINRHPEDFPELHQEPMKVKHVLDPWMPIR